MTRRPARLFGLPWGELAVGGDADLTVIDLEEERAIDPDAFLSKGRNTPFAGWRVKGWPVLTLVAGRVSLGRSGVGVEMMEEKEAITMQARLLLEDGTLFEGAVLRRRRGDVGEVLFHTGMTGYQEVLTDALENHGFAVKEESVAAPGPGDSELLFDRFLGLMDRRRRKEETDA